MEKRYVAITLIIILLIAFNGWFFVYKKNCKKEECFNDALARCKPAKFYGYRNNNLYLYKISRSFGKCRLNIKVINMAIGTEPDLIRLLKGNSMKCKIPKDVTITLDKIENLLDY